MRYRLSLLSTQLAQLIDIW